MKKKKINNSIKTKKIINFDNSDTNTALRPAIEVPGPSIDSRWGQVFTPGLCVFLKWYYVFENKSDWLLNYIPL